MNKQELIERMADKTGLTKKDCGTALDGLLSAVTEALQAGETVKLTGFGSFEVKHRAARTGRNPQTKDVVEIPAQTLPALAAEAGRSERMVTEFDPLDEGIAAQTVPQGGEPVLPDHLTAWTYVIEDGAAAPPEETEQGGEPAQPGEPEGERPQTGGPEGERPQTGEPEGERPQTGEPEDGQSGADVPALVASVSDIEYWDWDDQKNELTQKFYSGPIVQVTAGNTTWNDTGTNNGWYLVDSGTFQAPLTIDGRVTVTGDVYLILMDTHKLTVTEGIQVQDNDGQDDTESTNKLTIYAQTLDAKEMGRLEATGKNENAVIGGKGGYGGDTTGGKFFTGEDGENGNAFIIASSIDAGTNPNAWSGVIFVDGGNGQVYGSPTLKTNAETPKDKDLVIPGGSILTIHDGATLTNLGTIDNGGTILKIGGGEIKEGNISGSGNMIRLVVPTAKSGLVYKGESMELIDGGKIESAPGSVKSTLQYKTDDSNWSDQVPAGTDAGKYTVYYKLVIAGQDAAEDSVTVEIAQNTVQGGHTDSLNIANHLKNTYTYRLFNLLPTLPPGSTWGNGKYTLKKVEFICDGYYEPNTAKIIADTDSNALNTLSLPILSNNAEIEERVGTVTVMIQSDNYKDFDSTLDIMAKNRKTVTFSGVVGVTVPYTGQPVRGYTGTLEITDSEGKPVTLNPEIMYTGREETSYAGAEPPTGVGTYSVIFQVPDTDPEYIGQLSIDFEITEIQGGNGSGGGSNGSGSYTPPTPTYPPTVEKPGEGGGAPSTSPSNPKPGDPVSVKPRPDEGYEVEDIFVTDKDGNPVEVTKNPDGTYTFQQPKGRVNIKVTYKPIETPETPWNSPFTDVSEGDWYYEAVRFVLENGLMNGYSDGRFGPNDTLSRAQLAQILFNKEGRLGVNYLPDFSDVTDEAWYIEAVRWAVENGILNGYGDGRLGPQGQATRAQVAQMLKNFIENQENNT